MCKMLIALQVLQYVALVLCQTAFQLSGSMVANHLDNSIAKPHLCIQDGTAYSFLSRLACHILSLANMYCIILMAAYMPTHLNVEAEHHGEGWFQKGICFLT